MNRANRYACACAGFIVVIQLLNGVYNEALYEHSLSLYWSLHLLTFFVAPSVAFAFLNSHPSGLSDFSIELPHSALDWFNTLLIAAFLTALLWFIYDYATWIGYETFRFERPEFYFGLTIPDGPFLRPIIGSYSALTAGIAEEWTYKGALYYLIYRLSNSRFNTIIFATISAALFSLIHWENGGAEMLGTFAFASVGGYLFLKIRNIVPFIIAHASIDLAHFL